MIHVNCESYPHLLVDVATLPCESRNTEKVILGPTVGNCQTKWHEMYHSFIKKHGMLLILAYLKQYLLPVICSIAGKAGS